MSTFKTQLSEDFKNNAKAIREIILQRMKEMEHPVPEDFPSEEQFVNIYEISVDKKTVRDSVLISIDIENEYSLIIGIPPTKIPVFCFENDQFGDGIRCPELVQFFNLLN